mgnify:CR=1 FL=1
MRILWARVYLTLCALLLSSSPVHAQLPIGTSFRLGGSFMNLNTVDAAGDQRLTGFGFEGNATLTYKRFALGLGYLEGSLSPTGNGLDRDIVEGEALISTRATSWLRIGLGPHIRSLIIPEGTERWLFWELLIQAHTSLGFPRLMSVLEIRQVLSANIDVDDGFDGARGVVGSLRWDVSSLPIWVGLGYRIDRSNLGSGTRTEVMEHFVISVGVGRGTR